MEGELAAVAGDRFSKLFGVRLEEEFEFLLSKLAGDDVDGEPENWCCRLEDNDVEAPC